MATLDPYDKASINAYLQQNPKLKGTSIGGTYYSNPFYDPKSTSPGTTTPKANTAANFGHGGTATYSPKPAPAPKPAPKPAPAPSGGGGGGGGGGSSGFSIPRVSGADNPVKPLSRADLEAEAEDIVRRGQEFINGLGNGDLLDFHANRLAMMFDPGPAFQAVFGQNAQPPGTAPSYTLPEVQPGQMTPYFGQMLGDLWNPQDIPNLPSGPGQLNWMPQHLPNPYA